MTTQDEAVQAVYRYAAELVKTGLSAPQIESKLVEKGLDPASASIVVKNLLQLRAKAVKDAGKKNMIYGVLWCVGGVIITIGTYAAATGGGSYVITWGAIIFGAVQFFRGMSQYNGQ